MNTNAKQTPLLLEICIGSLDDALAAEAGGADRLELNSALPLGGLTPSLAVLEQVKQAATRPIIAMLRPREGGFAYSPTEFLAMRRDLDLLLEHGTDGIATGLLLPGGEIDLRRCEQLRRQTKAREFVFHRAFDMTPRPREALEQLIDLGVTRVLTSGGQRTARDGVNLLKELVERAADRIEILPGGGVRAENVQQIVQATGCRQVHAAVRQWTSDRSCEANNRIFFGQGPDGPTNGHGATDPAAVRQLCAALDAIPTSDF